MGKGSNYLGAGSVTATATSLPEINVSQEKLAANLSEITFFSKPRKEFGFAPDFLRRLKVKLAGVGLVSPIEKDYTIYE